MGKLTLFLSLISVILFSTNVVPQSLDPKPYSIPQPFDPGKNPITPAGPTDIPSDLSMQAAIPVHPVDIFVENFRSILGAGRNIVRSDGDIQAAYLEGTTGSYEWYWVGSTDEGISWSSNSHLGGLPIEPRYPAISVNVNGTYIAYHENTALNSRGYVLYNPDPFTNPDGFTVFGSLTPGAEDNWISFIDADRTGNKVAYGWYDFVNGNLNVGVSADSASFPNVSPIYTGDAGYGPGVAIEGNHVFVSFITSDSGFVPTDTAITNHPGLSGGQWYAFTESTDAGATWSTSQPLFGLTLSDFPTTRADLNGTIGVVAAAGGTNWNNHTQPIFHDGYVHVPTSNTAVTLNDGNFQYGFWDGLTISGASWKTIGPGGVWEHAAVSEVEQTGNDIRGDTWYVEISGLPGSSIQAITYVDRAPDPDVVHIRGTSDDWVNVSDDFYSAGSDLGISDPTADLFIATSPLMHLSTVWPAVDLVFLAHDGAAVINTTLYHAVIQITGDDIEVESKSTPNRILLQNYPNPFNPRTTIRFRLRQEADVRLTVYNALGQSVRTLLHRSMAPAEHHVVFDGSGLASGVYFYSLTVNGLKQTGKMLLVR